MKISVVIPVYNQVLYLAECLDSVLSQTLRDIEVVCVDDGSTDGSEKMLDEYAARDSRVKVIHQENAGVGNARNAGIDAAHGEFIAFMDPDDKYPDDGVLADLVRGAEDHDVDVCGGSLLMMDGRKLEPEFTFTADGMIDYRNYQFEYGFYRYVYRRRMLNGGNIRFSHLVRFQDVPFCVNALHAAGRIYALKRVSYLYRDGHKTVEWSADEGLRALAHVEGLMATYDLAVEYGYSAMAVRLRDRLKGFVKLLCSESNGLRTHLGCVINERDSVKHELESVISSKAYKVGELLAWPVRKIKNLMGGR